MLSLYIILKFFDEASLKSGKFYYSKKQLVESQRLFADKMAGISIDQIEGCIAFLVGKKLQKIPARNLQVCLIENIDGNIKGEFIPQQELQLSSGDIQSNIYYFSMRMGWINNEQDSFINFYALDREDYERFRKLIYRRADATKLKIELDELRYKEDWLEICNRFEPLEEIEQRYPEIWDNHGLLYCVADACYKISAQDNKMGTRSETEREKYLSYIRRYRLLAEKFFKQCYACRNINSTYVMALVYFYYRNICELRAYKGRKDGVRQQEIANTCEWCYKALELSPDNLDALYFLGRICYEYLYWPGGLNLAKNSKEEKMKRYMLANQESVNKFSKVHALYQTLNQYDKEQKKVPYSQSLYFLGKCYCDQLNLPYKEYILARLTKSSFPKDKYEIVVRNSFSKIAKAIELLNECFFINTGIKIEELNNDVKLQGQFSTHPADILRLLGLVYLNILFIKKEYGYGNKSVNFYAATAQKLLKLAMKIGMEDESASKSFSFIKNDLAKVYLLVDRHDLAIELLNGCRATQMKNTLGIALCFAGKYKQAEDILVKAYNDSKNKITCYSVLYLCAMYKGLNITDKYNLSKLKCAQSSDNIKEYAELL